MGDLLGRRSMPGSRLKEGNRTVESLRTKDRQGVDCLTAILVRGLDSRPVGELLSCRYVGV